MWFKFAALALLVAVAAQPTSEGKGEYIYGDQGSHHEHAWSHIAIKHHPDHQRSYQAHHDYDNHKEQEVHFQHDHHHHIPHHIPKYEFSYHVKDPHTHDHKSQWEERHGGNVRGHYGLTEPEGNYRSVHYTADDHNGFMADVHHKVVHHYEKPHHHQEPNRHEEPHRHHREQNHHEEPYQHHEGWYRLRGSQL